MFVKAPYNLLKKSFALVCQDVSNFGCPNKIDLSSNYRFSSVFVVVHCACYI